MTCCGGIQNVRQAAHMAIGSSPEIGVTFFTWGKMTDHQRAEWFAQVRSWGKDGVTGYGTVHYPEVKRINHHHKKWNNDNDRTAAIHL